ncbi:MAG TPA: response regulator, partial [Candidatus Methylomirabilis sp.]|nr:response regulator [Candidatus Methylomirabilis sp.]
MPERLKSRKGTILIVDDDAGLVRKLQEPLERRGYSIVVVRSKQEALESIANSRLDLMALDLEKPHLESRQILAALRADEANRHLPVIVFTTGAIPQLKVQGLQWGADDFIDKPVDSEEFAARIEVCLRISRLRQEALAKNRALSALHGVATSLSRSLNLKEILEQALGQIIQLMEMDYGVVRLPDNGGQEVRVSSGKGAFAAELEAIGSLPASEEFAGAVATAERPVLIGDVADARGAFAVVKALPGVRSAAGLPLVSK